MKQIKFTRETVLNRIKRQDGLIFKQDLDNLYEVAPNMALECKIKGSHGDRGIVKSTVKEVFHGDVLSHGEYISQVWL